MKRLISTDRNLVQRAQSFYKRYACNQYPWSAKYPWIIGRNKQDEIQSLTYVLDESDALQTETYQTVLSLPTHNAVADHQIYEENEPHYGYGKIMIPYLKIRNSKFIPTTARTIKLLSFDQFEANFNSNIFQTKPKYLYSNGNDGNKVQSDVSFVQLSPSNSQRNCREFDNECEI
eukprot:90872_1